MKPRGKARHILSVSVSAADKAHWTALGPNDFGVPVHFGERTWPTLIASGDFSGASVALQGSHGHRGAGPDPWAMTWYTLSPPLTSPGAFRPLRADEHYEFCRPVVFGGDGMTRIDVRGHHRGASRWARSRDR